MAFNPDEYLASSSTFNPDAYLGVEPSVAKPQQEYSVDRAIKAAGTILPSVALGAAKPLLGLNQAAWQLFGSNRGDWPVQKLNEYQQELNKIAGPVASKFTSEPAALVGENILPTAASNRMLNVAGEIPSFAKMIGQNAALGGVTAFANPEKPGLNSEKFAEQKLVNTLSGMAIPAALTGTTGLIGGAVSPKFTSQAEKLLNQNVELTPGQRMGGALKRLEDKLTSYPIVGGMIEKGRVKSVEGFDKAAFKQVLEPIGGQVPKEAGREGMQAVEQQVKHAYDDLLPKLHFQATPEFNGKMAELRSMAQSLPNDLGKTFNENIDQIIAKRMSKTGSMDGINFKEAESDLSRMAKDYLSSSSASERNLGKAFKQALVNMRSTLIESNPEKAAELAKTNAAFAKLSILRDAASKANTQDMFTPAQLAAAVKRADTSAGKNRTASGTALMQELSDAAVSTLPSKIADSGTVSRLSTSSPFGWALGAGASIPYALADVGLSNRPEFIKKLVDSLRGTSTYLTGPTVNKTLGE